ncbi:MAG: GspH/FimT family pseudopilin [Gammaproteobacteria bacterium]
MNTQRGFTIIELMAVVAVLGILLAIGVPSFRALLADNRIVSQLNQFSSTLALARSEAVKANRRVVVCPSTDGASCASGVDWDVGWISFIDRGGTDFQVDDDGGGNPADDPCGPNAGDDAADDCILSYVQALQPAHMTLRTNAGNDYISFNGLGASSEAAMFVLCDDRGSAAARAVVISNTGRVSVREAQNDGSPLSCSP